VHGVQINRRRPTQLKPAKRETTEILAGEIDIAELIPAANNSVGHLQSSLRPSVTLTHLFPRPLFSHLPVTQLFATETNY